MRECSPTSPSGGGREKAEQKTGKSLGKKILKGTAVTLAVLLLLTGLTALGGYIWFTEWAKDAEFDAALLPTATAMPTILDRYGNEMEYAADDYIAPSDIPEVVKGAFVALEDRRFYSHKGYDVKAMLRALVRNVTSGGMVEGASTITQQLVKNTHLSSERTLKRKLNEIAIAMKIEENYSKDEILAMYLSVIYFGAGAYGINQASRVYFGCSPDRLTAAQAATLAGILKNPARYSPKKSIKRATERRDLVLDVMCREGYLTEEERDAAKKEKMRLAEESETHDDRAAQYVAAAVDEVCKLLGMTEYRLQNSGLTVMTAYDPEHQKALTEETAKRGNYSANGVDGAAALIDNVTGEVTAYHCTTGYVISRQAGSVLKPLVVYAPAFDTGTLTAATPLKDEKTDFSGYSPENFGGVYYGDTTPREALKKSMNTAAVKALSYLGAERAVDYGIRLGLPLSSSDANLALALGSTAKGLDTVTLAGAYASLARGGGYIRPHFVRAVVKDGVKVWSAELSEKRVFSPEAAAVTTDILLDTVKDGTARALSSLPFPLAGKTGTVQKDADHNTDAWSVSYTTEHTLAVWHGGDKMTELGGGHPTRHAANIWRRIYGDKKPGNFLLPRGVERCVIDDYSTFRNRRPTLATPSTPQKYTRTELFLTRYLPDERGSAFISPTTDLTVRAASDGGTQLTFTAQGPFVYTVLCRDTLGERVLGSFSAEKMSLDLPQRFFSAFPGASSGLTLLGTEKINGECRYPDVKVTLGHTPFSFGGKVTYTLKLSISGGDDAVIGSVSADCFPYRHSSAAASAARTSSSTASALSAFLTASKEGCMTGDLGKNTVQQSS